VDLTIYLGQIYWGVVMLRSKILVSACLSPAAIFACLLFAGLPLISVSPCHSQIQTAQSEEGSFRPDNFTDARFLQYEQQLNAILKTRRNEEREFIAQIVSQVRQGKIPAQIVQTSFHWVHKKRPRTNFPFIYFEKVLRLQATKIGIGDNVPDFDFSIYRSIQSGNTSSSIQR
jgi:hypothetical protein